MRIRYRLYQAIDHRRPQDGLRDTEYVSDVKEELESTMENLIDLDKVPPGIYFIVTEAY